MILRFSVSEAVRMASSNFKRQHQNAGISQNPCLRRGTRELYRSTTVELAQL